MDCFLLVHKTEMFILCCIPEQLLCLLFVPVRCFLGLLSVSMQDGNVM